MHGHMNVKKKTVYVSTRSEILSADFVHFVYSPVL
jgi:hypothetical protein